MSVLTSWKIVFGKLFYFVHFYYNNYICNFFLVKQLWLLTGPVMNSQVIDQFLNPLRSRTWPKVFYTYMVNSAYNKNLFISFFFQFLSVPSSTLLFIIPKLHTFLSKTHKSWKKALIRLMIKNFAWLRQFTSWRLTMIFVLLARNTRIIFHLNACGPLVCTSWLWWSIYLTAAAPLIKEIIHCRIG